MLPDDEVSKFLEEQQKELKMKEATERAGAEELRQKHNKEESIQQRNKQKCSDFLTTIGAQQLMQDFADRAWGGKSTVEVDDHTSYIIIKLTGPHWKIYTHLEPGGSELVPSVRISGTDKVQFECTYLDSGKFSLKFTHNEHWFDSFDNLCGKTPCEISTSDKLHARKWLIQRMKTFTKLLARDRSEGKYPIFDNPRQGMVVFKPNEPVLPENKPTKKKSWIERLLSI